MVTRINYGDQPYQLFETLDLRVVRLSNLAKSINLCCIWETVLLQVKGDRTCHRHGRVAGNHLADSDTVCCEWG